MTQQDRRDEPSGPVKYEQTGQELGRLVDSKQAQYGSMAQLTEDMLKILYPNGVEVQHYDRMGLVVRILDKLGRLTRGDGTGDEDAFLDIAGYGLLGSAMLKGKRHEL